MHWLHRHRLWIVAGICVFVTGCVLIFYFTPDIPFFSNVWRADQNVQDLLRREGRKTPTRPDFVWVGLNQEALEFKPVGDEVGNNRALQLMAAKSYPWSREVWALLLDRLMGAGARLVLFDVTFSAAREGDEQFRAALERYHDKVVLGANVDLSNVRELGGNAQDVPPSPTLIPPPHLKDDRVGYIVFFPDRLDQKIRSIFYSFTIPQLAGFAPAPGQDECISLSARALQKLGRTADFPQDFQPHVIRFTDPYAYRPYPLTEVLADNAWHSNYKDGAFFKDKIIVVGSSAQIQHDVFDTPISPETPGPTLHLHALAAALQHDFLHYLPVKAWFAFVVVGGVAAFILLWIIRRPLVCLATFAAVTAIYLVTVRLVYDARGLFLLVVPTMTAFNVSGIIGLGFEYTLEILERMRTRRTLERYVSKNLVAEILENPDSYYHSLLGVRVPATMLFSDLVGFTTLSEKADPEALVKQLNEYLEQMTAVVFRNGGTLDKFIGDAIMCVWGNVKSLGVAEDARAAVRTALGMRQELHKLNEKWKTEGRMGLGMGIGINQGEVIVGNIGSHERMDPTVIGDSVNLASRLEALTRQYHVDVLIGATAAELGRDEFYFRSVARAQVKGKSEPVDVFTLIGARNEDVDLELVKWVQTYEEGMEKFRQREFTDAKILFSRFLEFYPDDFLAKMYLDRALEYEQAPPDESWNAVEVFTKK